MDVLERLGVERSKGKMYHCPNPEHEDRRASSSVKNNYIHCFVCNETWRVDEVVMLVLGINKKEAIRWLIEEFRLDITKLFVQGSNKLGEEREKLIEYDEAIGKMWVKFRKWVDKQGGIAIADWYSIWSEMDYIIELINQGEEIENKQERRQYYKEIYELSCKFLQKWVKKVEKIKKNKKMKEVRK
jgi:hypothetical protein